MTIPIGGTDRADVREMAERTSTAMRPDRVAFRESLLSDSPPDILERLRALEEQCAKLAARLRAMEDDGR